MRILVINCGSSSVKYQLVDTATKEPLAWGIAEKIGSNSGLFTYKNNSGIKISKIDKNFPSHKEAVLTINEYLAKSDIGVIKDPSEIDGVGHRVVHGGDEFRSSVKITEKVIDKMKELTFLAPLHNPANIKGIEVCQKLFPNHEQCGVFDTAYHQTMPDYAAVYPLAYKYYEEHRIKRYGFHGTSHRFVAKQAADLLNKDIKDLKIITCHLGNGASICAIKNGKSIDTSMGLTPLEGLMMGTRAGDIDPAIPLFLMDNLKMSIDDINQELNKNSGILGITGKCSDMRELHELITDGDKRAKLALAMYSYRLKKYIGSYIAALGGLDILAFTGGIGERDEFVRELATDDLDFLGIKLDKKLNLELNKKAGKISTQDSRVPVYIVPTDEELVIALDTEELIKA